MKYLYYPGCSLEGTALEYNTATQACMAAAGAELIEVDDWTCCGASAAEAVSYWLSLALPARNLALAEAANGVQDLLVPCSACYLNLKTVEEKTRQDPDTLKTLNGILAEDELTLKGRVRVRHLLDVLATDVTAGKIAHRRVKPLTGLRIAPYYGCQCLRPYRVFDDPEAPTTMEPLIEATGASVHHWDMGARCCGASHMNTKMEVGIELVCAILGSARGADAIATVCPMCQMNLEAYQKRASDHKGEDLTVSVVYLPQLLGLAMGLSESDVRLDLNLAVTGAFREKLP